MKIRNGLQSNIGVIGIATALTIIVLVESIFPPWAPYFIIYAGLAILIPLLLHTYHFGPFWTVLKNNWRIILIIFAIAFILDEGISSWLYQHILNSLGIGGNPYYSIDAALGLLASTAAQKFNITYDQAMLLYALFILVWAPIGEELFYRGYIQGVLRQHGSFKMATLVSAAFFGIRHAAHFFFLWPNVPLVAAISWAASTFVFGLLMSYLYEKTHSLFPPMLVHLGVNLIEIILSF
jgi:membrane protease YdiL (CAAX protease family)